MCWWIGCVEHESERAVRMTQVFGLSSWKRVLAFTVMGETGGKRGFGGESEFSSVLSRWVWDASYVSGRAVSWHLNIQDWSLGSTGYLGVVSIYSSFMVWISHLESTGREDWDQDSWKMERWEGLVSGVEHGVLKAKRSVSLRKEKSPVCCCSETEMKTEPSSEFGRVRGHRGAECHDRNRSLPRDVQERRAGPPMGGKSGGLKWFNT